FLAGKLDWAVRWNTVKCSASLAITGMDCTPLEPVLITPTFLPVKSTCSCGQFPDWYHSPVKEFNSLKSGTFVAAAKQTTAVIKYVAVSDASSSVKIFPKFVSSWYCALITVVLN